MFCPMCGNTLRDGSAFCSKCGHKLAVDERELCQTPVNSSPQPTPATSVQAAKKSPRKPSKQVGIIAGAIAVIALIAVGLGVNAFMQDQQLHGKYPVVLSITADGYNPQTDTRFPVQVTGTDVDGASVDELWFVNGDGTGAQLPVGEYELNFPASPLTATGVFYDVPAEPVKVTIGKEDPKTDASNISAQVVYTPVDITNVPEEKIAKAHEYAVADPEDKQSKADKNKEATVKVRQEAIERKAAEEKAAQNAQKKQEFQSRLAALDNGIIADFNLKRPDGMYEIHTLGVMDSILGDYSKKYSSLASEVIAYLQGVDPQKAQEVNNETAASSKQVKASEISDIVNAVFHGNSIEKMEKGEKRETDYVYGIASSHFTIAHALSRL